MIAFVESTPDTLLTLTNGEHVLVREPLDKVVALAVAYHQLVHEAAPQERTSDVD